MKSYSSREVIAILKKDGWYEFTCEGDHHQFKHPHKKGRVTVPHPVKNLAIGTLDKILPFAERKSFKLTAQWAVDTIGAR